MFGEPTSLQWWVGAVTILVGAYLLRSASGTAAPTMLRVPLGPSAVEGVAAQEQDAEEEEGGGRGTPARKRAKRRTRRA